MADRSLLFSFVSVDSSSSTDERKTSMSVHRCMSHEIDTHVARNARKSCTKYRASCGSLYFEDIVCMGVV